MRAGKWRVSQTRMNGSRYYVALLCIMGITGRKKGVRNLFHGYIAIETLVLLILIQPCLSQPCPS
jgi:uncharacterized membrane protein